MKFYLHQILLKERYLLRVLQNCLRQQQKNPFRIAPVPVLRLQTEAKVQRMLYCLQFRGSGFHIVVCGPLWKKTDCFYGKLDEERAVMEMAAASGLPLLTEPERDPEKTTTYGTGEMILDALDRGFRDISDRNRRIGDE